MKITLKQGQNLFFTSDTHYSHKNICEGTSTWSEDNRNKITRAFGTLEVMNSVLVDSINRVIQQDDILFHLGDWSFGGFDKILDFRKRIVCRNIHIVVGNHDHHIVNNRDNVQELFESVSIGNLELEVKKFDDKYKFFLNHYPTCSWKDMNRGVIHLFGHVHLPYGLNIMRGKAMDVGVDGNEMEPYSLLKMSQLMRDKPVCAISLPFDHHVKD